MMMKMLMTRPSENLKIGIMSCIILFLLALTAYSSLVLNTQILYTHLFYYPIILAAFWWRRRGMIVPIFLASSLFFFEILAAAGSGRLLDAFLRSVTFCVFGFVAANLVETKHEKEKIEYLRNELEFLNDLLFHDIRNYNLLAHGYLEILERTFKEEEASMQLLEKSKMAIERSSNLLSNVRKVRSLREKWIQDSISPTLRKVDMVAAIDQSLELLKESYPEVGLRIEFEHPSEPCFVMADEFINDIFMNLLTNAIKYTPDESKIIEINIEKISRKDSPFWKVSIGDYGPGIPDDRKKIIFDQLNGEIKSSGIGLSITRILVESFNGKIWVEDRKLPSKGSIFIVMLPITT
ncbi:MAG: sensor histidine kinase, partial [Candidatus Hodarchaeota archaeon]